MLAKEFDFAHFGYFLEEKQALLQKLMHNEYRGPVLTQRVCGDTFGVASVTKERSLADQLDCVDGEIPGFDRLKPAAQDVVRVLGVYRDQIPPEKEGVLL